MKYLRYLVQIPNQVQKKIFSFGFQALLIGTELDPINFIQTAE